MLWWEAAVAAECVKWRKANIREQGLVPTGGIVHCHISSDQQKPSRAIMALDALGPQVPAA
jgi:hypothetical protein